MSEDKPDCPHYHEWTWGEPPLEPGENGRLITERECKRKTGYQGVSCSGHKIVCELENKP